MMYVVNLITGAVLSGIAATAASVGNYFGAGACAFIAVVHLLSLAKDAFEARR